ncbi:tRNA (adenosine(37)-N6)-threonylcarbamoyltransferase complex ATPase subunit type 1 TsaE [Pelobacter seleniigenes]|uniref:tRNA (adenosine(37)-N6)-threonylcarbamoyltransferase complex ATPase subunit type 1 TsaE n=1 Tax=Pelobacter seleniigenes TaxID=407188 RepID=UPI0004A78634|nr:tRNA (adenosine(37)-N6)-threonylcarbamoyltransferase complex ATPase subunit type 1 TsaE [Pelobacter seleniigenes]
MSSWVFTSSDEAATCELGRLLGCLLEDPALILLEGDLGTGKSVFARGVARGLGVDARIPITSPTFTLMNHYRARLDLYHFDLYRLTDPDELIEIGFDDYAYGSGVALVEWPEKTGDTLQGGLWVRLQRLDNERRLIELSAQDEDHRTLLERLRAFVVETAVEQK